MRKIKKDNHCDRKYKIARNRVRATGNKWAMENFNNLNRRH